MKRPFLRICLVALVFGIAFLLGRIGAPPGRREAGEAPPTNSAHSTKTIAGSPPANPGLASLWESLVRQLDSRADRFSGSEFDKLLADHSGTGAESAQSYATRWAGADPAGMWEWVSSRAGWKPDYVSWVVFHSWARKDAKAAVAAFGKLPAYPTEERSRALGALIAGLGVSDAAAARELAQTQLPLLAGNPRFYAGFKGSDSFWKVLAGLPDGPDRNKVLAGYLNACPQNDGEVGRRWGEAPESIRLSLVAGGFPTGQDLSDAVFASLPEMVVRQAVASGDGDALYRGLLGQVKRDPAKLNESVILAQEKMTGRNRVECPAELFRLAGEQDFALALDCWRSLPDGLVKARAAGALEKAAPEDFKSVMETEISRLSPADIKRARGD